MAKKKIIKKAKTVSKKTKALKAPKKVKKNSLSRKEIAEFVARIKAI